ncbi:TolC family protein [Collimonas silvisoli]|uniref:TolC family protein n=1 Tax=Collimonas silvisoli TaxID=2825884 RepID=UPI001B8C3778|nr:TolC family protein [Collimonas silvisoli]
MTVSVKRALHPALGSMLALTLMVSAPSHADAIWADPLRTANEISGTPASAAVAGSTSCGFSAQLPSPLTLLDAVERALCRNPQTRQAWANVKVQAAAVGVSRAAYLPSLNASGSRSKGHSRTTYPDFPQADSSLKTDSSTANLSLSWVLYDFGLRAANLESARQLLNAANATQDDTLQTVFLNTVQGFYQAQAAQAMLTATMDAEQAAERSFKASAAKYQAGAGTLADKLQAQTSYAQESLKRAQAAGDLQSALGSLAIAMGWRPNTPLTLADLSQQANDAPLLQQAVDDLIADAVRIHPKILAAQAQWKSAQAQVDAARAEGRPTLSLFASGDRNDTPINQVSSRQSISSRSIGVQITIPLFDGFSRTYKVRGAQAQAEAKQADLADVEQQVMLEVWKSAQALRTEAENLNTTDILLHSARQSFDVAQGRYKAGVGTILELLKAQSDLASAQQQRILALSNWQTARLRLAASLGRLRMDEI